MNRLRLILGMFVVAAVAGCGGPSPSPAENEPAETRKETPAPAPVEAANDAQVSMTGSMTLRLFEPDMEGGESRKPSFEISSPQCSLLEDGRWALTDATAIIYGEEGDQTTFHAGRAEFDEEAETASLGGGVTVDFGQQHVEMQNMTWSNGERIARSESPLSVTDGETRLSAEGMEYHADTKSLKLRNVTGTVSMNEQGSAS